jgi:hypothetical protein
VRAPLAPLLAGLLASCAAPAPRPAAPPPLADLGRFAPEVQAAIRERRLLRGMDAAAVRLAWGEPDAVERTSSAAAPSLEYQRWSWRAGPGGPSRFAWLADGRVVDVLVPPAGGPEPTGPTR